MTSPTAIRKPAKAAKAAPGRVFNVSSKGIPRVTAPVKAKIQAAARSTSKHRKFPELITDS
ncbi:hypothetical protein [Variovorax sp. OV084]|jgi:hypothetical protein|uniref:hypothetical protein n=1 Tax=Variovorax sp. OV084 TaxID=1882777 RepID=UPI0008B01D02|nr:hypothetical protein [Variovorax sp. OV084]SET82140.1 hypothetical protein SAMN05443580_10757 [Variovorax sp. OV084]